MTTVNQSPLEKLQEKAERGTATELELCVLMTGSLNDKRQAASELETLRDRLKAQSIDIDALVSERNKLREALKGILRHVSPLNDMPEVETARELLGDYYE